MKLYEPPTSFELRPIGFISSKLTDLADCPLQESENAPEAFIDFIDAYKGGLKNISAGDKLVILTWFHLANRSVIQCYRRNLAGTEEFGVFSTRSPDRPNPIGLHSVTVLEVINEQRIKIFPMEALNGTPVVDVKPIF